MRYSMGQDPQTLSILAGIGAYEIMGQDGPVPVNMQGAKEAAAANILGQNGVLLRDNPPTQSRMFPLGFVSTGAIAAGAQQIVISRPQVIFRGQRLIVPSDIAGAFTIDDVKVGKNSQFVAEGGIPARVLQENAWGVFMQLDTAQISQNVQLTVTNISGAPVTFRAALIGNAVD